MLKHDAAVESEPAGNVRPYCPPQQAVEKLEGTKGQAVDNKPEGIPQFQQRLWKMDTQPSAGLPTTCRVLTVGFHLVVA